MRPRGNLRQALAHAYAQAGARAWRDVLPALAPLGINGRSRADVRLVVKTVHNMVAVGELRPVGRDKPAGCRVWRHVYELQPQPCSTAVPAADGGHAALQAVTRAWKSTPW